MHILLATEDQTLSKRIADMLNGTFPAGQVCAHTAADAEAAADLARKTPMDMLLIDLDLPGAIALMRDASIRPQGCLLYGITEGFGALKLHQSVMQISLDGYFLKQSELRFIVEEIRTIWEEKKPRFFAENEENAFLQRIQEEKPRLYENFIRDLLSGVSDDLQLVSNTGDYLRDYIQAEDQFCVIAVRPVKSRVEAEQHFSQMMLLRDDIASWIPSVNRAVLVYQKYVVLLLDVTPWKSIPNAALLMEYGLRSHIDAFERAASVRISVGISRVCEGLMSLRPAFLQAKAAAKWGMNHEEMLPLVFFNDYVSNSGVSLIIDHRMIEELLDAQTDGNPQQIRAIVHRYLAGMPLKEQSSPDYMNRIQMDAAAMLMLIASSLSVTLDARQISVLLNCSEFSTAGDLVDWFMEQMEKIKEYRSATVIRKEKMLVEHAKKLVIQNIAHHYTTQEMASVLGLSVNYFGMLFKRSEGIGFLEYMTNTSLMRAVTLLSNPKLRLNEVCLLVGYDDANYFSRVFKKHYGCTPSQFRNRIE